ncbi:transformation related protein 53 target 5 [Cricetulus griseus]
MRSDSQAAPTQRPRARTRCPPRRTSNTLATLTRILLQEVRDGAARVGCSPMRQVHCGDDPGTLHSLSRPLDHTEPPPYRSARWADGSGLLTLRRHIPDAVTHFSDVTAPLPSSSSAIIYCSARVVAAVRGAGYRQCWIKSCCYSPSMSPSTKKRPKNRLASKVQDEKLQDDKINQPVSKLIERNRLKTVLKNLSLLKLLRSSNNRIQELHSLAKRCWKSMLRVPKMLQISSGDNNVCNKVKQNNGEFQEIRALEKKPESKKAESIGKSKTKTSNGWKSTEGSKGSPAAVPWRKEKAKSKVPKTRASLGLHTRGQKRKPQVKKPQAVFLKTYHHRTPMRDTKPLDVTDQFVWFEGLPTRIRPPGRRIMCRASTFRCTKRPCTRFCSVSL